MKDKILDFEKLTRQSHCDTYPELQIAESCLANMTLIYFCSIANHFPDVGDCVQVGLMGPVWSQQRHVMPYNQNVQSG